MNLQHSLFFVLFVFCSYVNARERYPLELISLDGCRWDYLSRAQLPAMTELRKDGVAAAWVQETFRRKHFPRTTPSSQVPDQWVGETGSGGDVPQFLQFSIGKAKKK